MKYLLTIRKYCEETGVTISEWKEEVNTKRRVFAGEASRILKSTGNIIDEIVKVEILQPAT